MTAGRKPEPCSICNRAPRDGCSHIDCPNRKPVTAQPRGFSVAGGVRAYEPNRFENNK